MACLSSTRRAQLQARLTKKEIQLTNLYTTFEDLSKKLNRSYKFESGEGTQQTTRVSMSEVQKQINNLESDIDWLQDKLNCGSGLSDRRLRR